MVSHKLQEMPSIQAKVDLMSVVVDQAAAAVVIGVEPLRQINMVEKVDHHMYQDTLDV